LGDTVVIDDIVPAGMMIIVSDLSNFDETKYVLEVQDRNWK
jgi:hypothetical protein